MQYGRFLYVLTIGVFVFLTGAVRAESAGVWTVEAVTSAEPMLTPHNAVYDLRPYCATNGNAWPVSEVDLLVDGAITIGSSKNTRNIGPNTVICWDFSEKYSEFENGIDLTSVRIFSAWNDGGRSQIRVGKLCVKYHGSDEWVELENSGVTGPTGAKNYCATYANAEGTVIAAGITQLMVDFGSTQQAGYVGVSEIEAGFITSEKLMVPITLTCNEELGSIVPDVASAESEWPAESVLTLTAVPAEGVRFARWFGDVPEEQATLNPLPFSVLTESTVIAVFEKDWVWDNGYMTDGYWKLTAPVTDGKINITGCSLLADHAPLVDFKKPIVGTEATLSSLGKGLFQGKSGVELVYLADSIVSIGENCFREMSSLREIVLSENLEFIGHCCFYGSRKLVKVTPFLPDTVKEFGNRQNFTFCPLTLSDKLVISNPEFTALRDQAFYTTGLREIDLSQSGIVSIGINCFRASGSLTTIHFPETLETLDEDIIYGCGSMRSMYFASKPDTFTAKTFEGAPSTMRIVVYSSDQEWMDYFDELAALETPRFFAWDSLSASMQAQYTFTDECVPFGRVKIGDKGNEIFVATRKGKNPGLLMLLK